MRRWCGTKYGLARTTSTSQHCLPWKWSYFFLKFATTESGLKAKPVLLPADCAVTLRSTTKTTPSCSSKSWKPTTSLTRRTGMTSQTQVGPPHPHSLLLLRLQTAPHRHTHTHCTTNDVEWFSPFWRFPRSQGLHRQPDGKRSSQAFYVRAGAQTPLVRYTGANYHTQKQTTKAAV